MLESSAEPFRISTDMRILYKSKCLSLHYSFFLRFIFGIAWKMVGQIRYTHQKYIVKATMVYIYSHQPQYTASLVELK